MKFSVLIFSILLFGSFISNPNQINPVIEQATPEEVQTGQIEVNIAGIKKMKGVVEVAIYNKKTKWLKSGGAYDVKRVEVDGRDVVVVFDNLPYGKYAICSYHDVNANNKFDRNWVGIPKEPYAMSKKAKSKLRKPKFKEMAIELKTDHYTVESYFKKF